MEAHAKNTVASVRTNDSPTHGYSLIDSEDGRAPNERSSLPLRCYTGETYESILQSGSQCTPLVADQNARSDFLPHWLTSSRYFRRSWSLGLRW